MSNAIIGLSSAAVEGPVRYSFDPHRGPTTIRTFTGTMAQISALEASARWNGWATDVMEGPVWKLTATLASDDRGGTGSETPIDTWELFGNSIEKDVLSSAITPIKDMPATDISFMRDILDGKLDARDYDYSTAGKTSGWGGSAGQQALADQVFKGILAGEKSTSVNVPTLRHTKTASRDYEFQSAVTGVSHIYSSSAINNLESLPGWIYWNIPAAPATNPYTRTDGIIVFTGWKKSYPQIQVVSGGKSQIVIEWVYGDWTTVLYPNYHA